MTSPSRPPSPAHRALALLHLVEDTLLTAALALMILLAAFRIAARNLGGGFVWTDELLRILVLWIGFLGAVVASREGRHITMDLLSRFLPPRLGHAVHAAVGLFTATVSGALAWFSYGFVAIEHEFGSTVLGGAPAWVAQAVLPVGFALIAARYLFHALKDIRDALSPNGGDEAAPEAETRP